MCLYTDNIKPYISNKDIIVGKFLNNSMRPNGDRMYVTPYMFYHVNLGETLVAKTPKDIERIVNGLFDYRIKGGVIHSVVKAVLFGDSFYKAIIPSGTPFYIGNNYDVASEKLHITKDKMTNDDWDVAYNNVLEIIIENNREENEDGICIGDVLLSNMKHIHIEDYDDEKYNELAIGVVAYFIDNKPYVISLHEELFEWGLIESNNPINEYSLSEALNDYGGKTNTAMFAKANKHCLNKFPALDYCLNYVTKGTSKGNWYLGSLGEEKLCIKNRFLINHSLRKIKHSRLLKSTLWSSSNYGNMVFWHSNPSNGCANGDKNYYAHNVRPFASF